MVYLIHFEEPVGKEQTDTARAEHGLGKRKNGYKAHARHYLGSTNNIDRRMRQHERGYGGRRMAHVTGLGIRWRIIRTWDLDQMTEERVLEARLKRCAYNPTLCPICNPDGWETRAAVGDTKERLFNWRGQPKEVTQ